MRRSAPRSALSAAASCAPLLLLAATAASAAGAQQRTAALVTTAHRSNPVMSQPAMRTPADSTRRYRVEIASGPLAEALDAFGRQTGMRVELGAPIDGSATAPDVNGTYTAQAALRLLLAGTGYAARFTAIDVVVIRRASARDTSLVVQLERVVVTARASRPTGYAAQRTSSATKTDTPLRDVPQAVTVISRQLIADQSAQSMSDVVRYVPGITMGLGEGHRDSPTIRGQATTADFFVDGVRDDAQYLRDVYNVERVEAIKGANAMAFGRGGGGGVLNRVSRVAGWVPTRALTLEGGSFDHRRSTLDIGQGFGGTFAARLNAMAQDSRNFRRNTSLERQGFNPTMSLLAGGAVVQLGYEYFADRRTVDRGVSSFQGRPLETDNATFFGDPRASRSRTTVNAATAMIERVVPGGITLRNRTRVASYDKFYGNVFPGAVTASGDSVNLSAYSDVADRRNLFNQLDAVATVSTGVVRHTLLLGTEVGQQRTENFRATGYFAGDATSIRVPVAAPTVDAGVSFRQGPTGADNRVRTRAASVYAQDQIALGAHVQAVAGVRYDRFAIAFHDNRTDRDLRRTDGIVSPRLGLVVKPVDAVSVYGTNSVSFLPSAGDQFSSLTATSQTLAPERFTNREVGLKWDLRPDLALSGALFRLDRTNSTAPDPIDPTRVVQTGRQRTTGGEATITGSITSRWQIAGGYSTQRARIVSRTSTAREGAIVPLVPRQTISLWNRVQILRALGTGLGVVHQAAMYAAIDNSVELPAFTRLDAAAFMTFTPNLRAQLNVENLLDRRYFATSYSNTNIMPGASRTLRLSVTFAP